VGVPETCEKARLLHELRNWYIDAECIRTVTTYADIDAVSSKARLTLTAEVSVTVSTRCVHVADAVRKLTFIHV